MKEIGKKYLLAGSIFIAMFVIWTILIQTVDKQPLGQNGTDIGFAAFNCWFHNLTGVNMTLYTITDWMGLVPLFVCMVFAGIGFCQLVKRRSLFKVDFDIIVLGVYYVVVILCYSFFEIVPMNYRPVLINGVMESSYPSSTTLLVITVMPTLAEQVNRRVKNEIIRRMMGVLSITFSLFMVSGRLTSGVHWFTDIVGSVFLSAGLFFVYKAFVLFYQNEKIK
jgi:membrane-associated phospholipid phosphatase